MSPVSERSAPEAPVTVRIEREPRGAWQVAMPGRHGPMSLEEARRVAYLSVAHARELIVHDAHERVLHRELIEGHRPPPPTGGLEEPGKPPPDRSQAPPGREQPPAAQPDAGCGPAQNAPLTNRCK